MEATIQRKKTSFRLREDLLERLKAAASLKQSSLNSYVESVLMDDVYHEPNETTVSAIKEVMEGRCSDKSVDLSSTQSFLKSILE
jgi:predicted DNA-binding protein